MNVGEILDQTFKMFGAQFKSYLGMSALGMAPLFGCGLLALILYHLLGQTTAIIVGLVAIIPITAVYLAMNGAIIKKTSLQISDQPISGTEAYRVGFHKAWPLFLGGLLYGLAALIGFILLIIPGIYVFISFSLYIQAIVVEDQGPWSTLGRSKKLIKGSWWRVFGIMFIINALIAILRDIISIPLAFLIAPHFDKIAVQIVNVILSSVTSVLFIPFYLIATTLLYYDLRIRKENLDLKIMVDNLTESGVQPTGVQA
jgi:uncharacterized membrane protein